MRAKRFLACALRRHVASLLQACGLERAAMPARRLSLRASRVSVPIRAVADRGAHLWDQSSAASHWAEEWRRSAMSPVQLTALPQGTARPALGYRAPAAKTRVRTPAHRFGSDSAPIYGNSCKVL